jgi:hypothetical protein
MTGRAPADRSFGDRVRSALSAVGDRLGEALPGGERTYPTPPNTMEDAEGREIGLHAYDESAFEALVEMYVDFDPSQRAQGTPPVGEEGVREWLSGTLLSGPSVVAWHGQRAVGHVAFVPDDTGKHELAIFVHQDYQRARGSATRSWRAGSDTPVRRASHRSGSPSSPGGAGSRSSTAITASTRSTPTARSTGCHDTFSGV